MLNKGIWFWNSNYTVMQTLLDKQKNYLIKKFHILLGQAGLDNEDKLSILKPYGVTSSRDEALSVHDLLDICNKLEKIICPDAGEMDRWRKRLIAAIGAWLRAMNKEENMNVIKAIASRAAGHEDKSFNSIPLERVRSLYYAFSKKTKDLKTVEWLTREEIEYSTWTN